MTRTLATLAPRHWRIAAIALLTLLSVIALLQSSVSIDGVRYFWLDDDQMISMRYARNLASGHGLVWNAGERVEGYTNFLWTLVMAAVHTLPIADAHTAVAVRAVNWALAGAVLVLSERLLRLLVPSAALGLGLPTLLIGLALGMDLLYWSVNGFETTLLTVAFLFVVTRILDESARGRSRPLTYLLIGALPLIRSDAYHVSAAAALLAIATAPDRRQAASLLSLALILPVTHLGWRFWYYADWLPNTYYLKVAEVSGLHVRGIAYARNFASHYAVALVFATLGTIAARDARRWLLLASVGIAGGHILLVGGDIFPHFRFFAHAVPVLLVLAVAAMLDAAPRMSPAHVLLAASLFLSVFLENGIYSHRQLLALRSFNGLPEQGVVTGVLIRRFTRPEARIAVITAGNAPYFSRRYAIDFLGKSDRHVARRAADDSGHVGHNKHDVDYSLSLQPDLIVTLNSAEMILRPDFCSPEDLNGFVCTLARHPAFVRNYLPYPVPIPYLLNGTTAY
ncbi:MAG: hypothetical protein ACRD1H_07370, partial [Vicinamibacterales bacterium]